MRRRCTGICARAWCRCCVSREVAECPSSRKAPFGTEIHPVWTPRLFCPFQAHFDSLTIAQLLFHWVINCICLLLVNIVCTLTSRFPDPLISNRRHQPARKLRNLNNPYLKNTTDISEVYEVFFALSNLFHSRFLVGYRFLKTRRYYFSKTGDRETQKRRSLLRIK